MRVNGALSVRSQPDAVTQVLAEIQAILKARAAGLEPSIGREMAAYLDRSGKMVRARFALLVGSSLRADPSVSRTVAIVAELIHNASLLHDDYIDDAGLRRGLPTPNARFGDKMGVLLGDVAVTEALAAARVLPRAVQDDLVETIREMALGEIEEERLRRCLDLGPEAYHGIISKKTAALFRWCARAVAEASGAARHQALAAGIGHDTGVLFQMVDDVLDLEGAETSDSNVGKVNGGKEQLRDLQMGRLTLPAILALSSERGDFFRAELQSLFEKYDPEAGRAAARGLAEGGFLETARLRARELAEETLARVAELPDPAGARELGEFVRALAERKC